MVESNLVMIAMRDEIAAQGVEQLLKRSRNLTTIRSYPHDERSLFRETESTQPAILITDDADTPAWRPEIATLFEICPDLHVVLVSLNANCAQLFTRTNTCYETEAEFLKIIETQVTK
jgi:hypothetical protein